MMRDSPESEVGVVGITRRELKTEAPVALIRIGEKRRIDVALAGCGSPVGAESARAKVAAIAAAQLERRLVAAFARTDVASGG